MTPDALGRRCAACRESVVDFTGMTDGQIVTFLHQYPGVSCGRFTEGPLDRPLLGVAAPAPRWRRWLAGAAAALGFGAAAAPAAQGQDYQDLPGSMPRPAASTDTAGHRPVSTAAEPDSIRIYGTVQSRWGLPLQAWVQVLIGPTRYRVRTNALGYFTIMVPTAQLAPEQTPRLAVSRYFFRTQSQNIELKPHRAYHFFLQRRGGNWPWSRRVMSGKFR